MSGPEWGSGFDSDGPDPYDPNDYYDLSPDENPFRVPFESSKESSGESSKKSGEQARLLPLAELCCRFIGQNLPFGTVQLCPSPLPEDLQRRIAFWSFPTEEKKLIAKAEHLGGASKHDVQSARRAKVENMLQSGMYLTGTILNSPVTGRYRKYKVKEEGECFRAYVQFDRGCITTTKCSCSKKSWCSHVLALCLARMKDGASVQLHPPVSEILGNFDRDQLQKLVQYSLNELSLDGVAVTVAVASRLLDKGSEINNIPGAPDLTAGGCPGETPVWQADKNTILSRLNSAYDSNIGEESRSYYRSIPDLLEFQRKLVGFKEFSSSSTSNTPSELHSLLLDENDNLSIALIWAVEKKLLSGKEPFFSQLQNLMEEKWVQWCFCRMLLPVMGMFFVSPAMSSHAKQDVTKSITQCLIAHPSGPIYDMLHGFLQISADGLVADTVGRHQLLTRLRKAESRTLPFHTANDANLGQSRSTIPKLLHSAMAVMEYMKFYDCASATEMEDMVSATCALLLPAIPADVELQEELVSIHADHEVEEICLPLLLEYGTSLLRSSTIPDHAAMLVFKLMGSQLPLETCSTDVMIFRNWAESVMITVVDESDTLAKASTEVRSKLASQSIKWLTQTCLALEGDPNPITALTGMWGMMRLVCRCGTDDCMKVVKQMTQELIGTISSTLSIPTSKPEGEDDSASDDQSWLVSILANSFFGLLVDLFTMLPAGDCQELFTTLYKMYPQPLDAKRSKNIKKRYGYGSWQKYLLDEASKLSQRCRYYFFPRQPPIADFEQQLLMANPDSISTDAPSDSEKAIILQVCCSRCSVFTDHIKFLEKLQRCLLEKSAPLQFEMQLLVAMVSNCVHYDWISRDKFSDLNPAVRALISIGLIHDDHSLCDCLLTSDDLGFSLEVLRDMWMFSIAPQAALELLEAVQGKASQQSLDIMCDILISALDCDASLQLRIFNLMIKIGAKPEYMLQAVNIASYSFSDSKQSSNQHRTAAIQCAEALGKSYNDHKATGTDSHMLAELRIKALDLLQQVKSITVDIPVLKSQHRLRYTKVESDMQYSTTVHLEAVMQVVCDTGQQALTDLLALVVLLPGEFLLPTLKGMNALCNYYHKETDTSEDEPLLLKLSPFNETTSALLENRKSKIKQLADFHDMDRIKRLVGDLKASFQYLGDEEGLTNFASFLHNGSLAHICNWEIPLHTEDGDDEDSDHEPLSFLMTTLRGH